MIASSNTRPFLSISPAQLKAELVPATRALANAPTHAECVPACEAALAAAK